MELIRPKVTNKNSIPVIIFKNGTKLIECVSIQEAGKWLQEYTNHRYRRFKQVYDGIIHGDSWSYNGATYSFTTDETIQQVKVKELALKRNN